MLIRTRLLSLTAPTDIASRWTYTGLDAPPHLPPDIVLINLYGLLWTSKCSYTIENYGNGCGLPDFRQGYETALNQNFRL